MRSEMQGNKCLWFKRTCPIPRQDYEIICGGVQAAAKVAGLSSPFPNACASLEGVREEQLPRRAVRFDRRASV